MEFLLVLVCLNSGCCVDDYRAPILFSPGKASFRRPSVEEREAAFTQSGRHAIGGRLLRTTAICSLLNTVAGTLNTERGRGDCQLPCKSSKIFTSSTHKAN